MILREFPDLIWLKKQATTGFENQQAVHKKPLAQKGWPTVILNTQTTTAYRPNIRGPLSIFMNRTGLSRCAINHHTVCIPQQHFFLSNQYEQYTLEMESETPVESFNIHFGEQFAEQLFTSLVTPADLLLEEHCTSSPDRLITFPSKLYPMDEVFQQLTMQLYTQHQHEFEPLLFEEQISQLLSYLLFLHRVEIKKALQLPAMKKSTRVELYKRLNRVTDFIRTHYTESIGLEELARISCLSKHHFLRLFKIAFGRTPHQFIIQLRIATACKLLKTETLSIQEIAYALGFEYANSFSRLFKKKIGIYPNAYRDAL